MKNASTFVWIVLAGAAFLLFNSTFIVKEWQQGIVLELGKPKKIVQDAGLKFKKPFIQEYVAFEKRLLEYDAAPRELLTADKQNVVVDNYSRWRISDPLLFYQSVKSENGAVSRLDDIIYSELREVLGRNSLKDLISLRRSELVEEVLKRTNEKTTTYGIEVVDVRIKRADLPEKNEKNVFARMRTERQRLAKKYRAEGAEEAQKIQSSADKQARMLSAEGKKQSEIIRGEGDAESTRIYAQAYNQDTNFYRFVRELEAYRTTFGKSKAEDKAPGLVISTRNEFLNTFRTGK